jgi:hypothetical protein
MFVIFCGLFLRLAINTEKAIASDLVTSNDYTFKAPFQIVEFANTYAEYKKIPGFDQDKTRIKQFLDASLMTYRIKPLDSLSSDK